MLDTKTVLEEAKALLLQNILEEKKARLLEIALRAHSMVAHDSGNPEEALRLQLVADDLADRFRPFDKKHSAPAPLD